MSKCIEGEIEAPFPFVARPMTPEEKEALTRYVSERYGCAVGDTVGCAPRIYRPIRFGGES